MTYLLSFLIGFVCASPFGPMGLLCLRRTLSHGVPASLAAILGIAAADAAWAFITINGLRPLITWITAYRQILGTVVGLAFMALGLHGLRKPPRSVRLVESSNLLAGFAPNFAVVFFNPSTCLFFSGVFALMDIGGADHDAGVPLGIALAVFVGVLSFWITLGCLRDLLRHHQMALPLTLVNRVICALIAAFGFVILLVALSNS